MYGARGARPASTTRGPPRGGDVKDWSWWAAGTEVRILWSCPQRVDTPSSCHGRAGVAFWSCRDIPPVFMVRVLVASTGREGFVMSHSTTKEDATEFNHFRFWVGIVLTCLMIFAVGFFFNRAAAAPSTQSSPCYSQEACTPKPVDGGAEPPRHREKPSSQDLACVVVGGVTAVGTGVTSYATGGVAAPAAVGAGSGVTSAAGCYTGQLMSK